MTVIGSESQEEHELRDFASAGATDFVASFFRCLANRMHGGPHNVVSAEYGG